MVASASVIAVTSASAIFKLIRLIAMLGLREMFTTRGSIGSSPRRVKCNLLPFDAPMITDLTHCHTRVGEYPVHFALDSRFRGNDTKRNLRKVSTHVQHQVFKSLRACGESSPFWAGRERSEGFGGFLTWRRMRLIL
jgi:hypothetical protein